MKKIIIILFCLLLVGCSSKKPSVLEEEGVVIQLICYEENGDSQNTLVFTQEETYIVYFFDDLDKVYFIMFADNDWGIIGYAYIAGADSSMDWLILTGEQYNAFLEEKSISLEDMNLLVENYFSNNKDKIKVVNSEDK